MKHGSGMVSYIVKRLLSTIPVMLVVAVTVFLLVRIGNSDPAAVIAELMNEDGSMSKLEDLMVFAEKHKFQILTIKELVEYRKKNVGVQ